NSDSTSSSYNKTERMGKGLVWNGATTDTPVVFMPLTISGTWPAATSSSTTDANYELIGPQVFRLEYCYLRTNGSLSITPPLDGNSHADLSQIAAIVVDIAVIDPQSRVLISDCLLAKLNGAPPPAGCGSAQV